MEKQRELKGSLLSSIKESVSTFQGCDTKNQLRKSKGVSKILAVSMVKLVANQSH